MSTTGPNTPEGKAVVSRNAVRHGLTSSKIVLPGVESEDEWEDHHHRIFTALDPVGGLEEELTERAALLLWRLRRGPRAERDAVLSGDGSAEFGGAFAAVKQLIAYLQVNVAPDDDGDAPFGQAAADAPPERPAQSLPGERPLNKIMRYEAQYSRQLFQTLNALQALQDRRKGVRAKVVHFQWH